MYDLYVRDCLGFEKKMNYILSFDEIDFDLVTYCVIIED